jgi:hypothetical protein
VVKGLVVFARGEAGECVGLSVIVQMDRSTMTGGPLRRLQELAAGRW